MSIAPQRVRSLDGLRGLAALVVVFHHSLLTGRTLAGAYDGSPGRRFPSLDWWLTYTPLHVVWAGQEAVIVFFILSGFVLVRATERLSFSWPAYYASRLVRLYLPVWAALGLGALLFELVPRTVSPHASWWLNVHAQPLTTAWFVHDAVIVHGTNWLVSPLWSLKWEVLFSLLLPLAALGASRHKWAAIVQAGALVAMIGVGTQTGHPNMVYLPMFGIGALMARRRSSLEVWAGRLSERSWWLFAAAAVLLVTSSWTLHDPFGSWFVPLETIGAALVVFVFAFWSRVRAVAEKPRAQWLGKRSFSLYLVHEPIVVSVALLLGATASPWLTLLIAVPASLVAAHLFFVCLERPSHLAARALSRAITPVAPLLAPSSSHAPG
jgi:peptidoglycan/LPS O-acetylase OafA/YrhL